MKKNYLKRFTILFTELLLILFAVSCKKDSKAPQPAVTNFAKLGLYEVASGTSRRVFIAISKVGTQAFSTPYGLVFDTGSTGMTIDATDILPASMITSSGIQVAGDSVNVNGITVTNQQSIISYGGVDGTIQEYGNLAYAPVTIGDGHGNITTPRIPIFLYYKVITANGKAMTPHSADVFGVAPGISYTSRSIASPLSYFSLPANVTNGFRLGMLSSAGFGTSLTYVPDLLYIGLTPSDLNSSAFVMHPLDYNSISGYSPNIRSSITYGNTTIPGLILFDTGTPATNIIEDSAAPSNTAPLPVNTTVKITTGPGFTYQFTTTSNYNLTQIENTSYSHDTRTIFSIDFFLSNEFLVDYTNHRIGLKNN